MKTKHQNRSRKDSSKRAGKDAEPAMEQTRLTKTKEVLTENAEFLKRYGVKGKQ